MVKQTLCNLTVWHNMNNKLDYHIWLCKFQLPSNPFSMCKYFVCHVSTSAARVVALKQVYLQKCEMKPDTRRYITSASKSSIRRFVIMEKAPTRAFPWLKAATTTFTFKTLLRHYAKWALTPRSLIVKLSLGHKSHKGQTVVGAFSVITNLRR